MRFKESVVSRLEACGIFTVATVFLLCGGVQAQPEVVLDADGTLPLEIISVRILQVHTSEPESGPHSLVLEVTLRNTSEKDVVAFALRWEWIDDQGFELKGRSFNTGFSMDPWSDPVLRSVDVLVFQHQIAVRSNLLRPTIDCVVFKDGEFYGPNESNLLGDFVRTLATRAETEKWLLNLLESSSRVEVIEILRNRLDLYREYRAKSRVRRGEF